MSLREGGRRRLREDVGAVREEEPVDGPGAEVSAGWATVAASTLCVLSFERSIHSFSAGTAGIVYCESAFSERSHFFGIHTPTSTRHAATRRFTLSGDQNEWLHK